MKNPFDKSIISKQQLISIYKHSRTKYKKIENILPSKGVGKLCVGGTVWNSILKPMASLMPIEVFLYLKIKKFNDNQIKYLNFKLR